MIHLGDITKISGYDAPIVDTVIFGAPCQDLSVAGKRQGMKHSNLGDEEGTRSGLFMEAVRIIKEMRERDANERRCANQFIRPRFAVYENVPGAFSSNKGEDFKIVLEELAKVADKDAVIPMPPKGKWANSGCIMGDGWSIAWRVLDGQFWGCTYYDDAGMPIRLGTPQRRKRIALVADFGGECAPEILFERKGLRGDTSQSRNEGQGVTSDTEGGIASDDRKREIPYTLKIRSGCEGGGKGALVQEDLSATLSTNNDQYLFQPLVVENHPADSRVSIDDSGKVQTLTSQMGTGGGNVPMVMVAVGIDCYNQAVTGDKSACLRAIKCYTDHIPCVAIDRAFFNQGKNALYDPQVYEDGTVPTLAAKGPSAVAYAIEPGIAQREGGHMYEDVSGSLRANAGDNQMSVAYCIQGNCIDRADTAGCNGKGFAEGVSYTLNTMDRPAVAYGINGDVAGTLDSSYYKGCGMRSGVEREIKAQKCDVQYIVRRLTPLECERLQGYPDYYTDIGDFIDSKGKKKTSSDAVRYKALGNSICLPPWKWVLKRLCSHYERDATMASLFDGIGGFPCLWEQINGKGTAVWSSEIEEFPDAVTKVRIG